MYPEIVTGDLVACADKAFEKLEADMRMLRLPPGVTPLSPADWDDVMLNLQAGKSGERAVLNLKSSHLQSLPYCLPALVCSDEDEACRHAERMIEQFKTDPRPEAHHRTTVRLFRRGCPFRLDLERFVGGFARHALGREFREEVAICRFFLFGRVHHRREASLRFSRIVETLDCTCAGISFQQIADA